MGARQDTRSSLPFAGALGVLLFFMGNTVTQWHTSVNNKFVGIFGLAFVTPLGDNGSVKPKEARISVRVDPETKARLQQAVADTGIDEPTLVKNCVLALLRYIDENGMISFPLNVVPSEIPKARVSASYPSPKRESTGPAILNENKKKKKKRKAA